MLPLLTVEIPPLLDYPNHLVRLSFLATGATDPVLSQMLATNWSILPNLGTEAVLPGLIRIMPLHVAGRLMLALILLLPVLGVAALNWTTFRTFSPWALGGSLVTCNGLFLLGFMNFGLSCGLAMLLAAAWFRFREDRPTATILAASLLTCVLFFCHLMGLVFFLILVGSYELERCWDTRNGPMNPMRPIASRIVLALPILIGPVILYDMTALHRISPPATWSSAGPKAMQAIYPVVNYDLALDLITAGLLLTGLVACVLTRHVLVPLRSILAILSLAVLFAVSPFAFKGLAWVDTRFSVMLGFAIFAGIVPFRVPRPSAVAAYTIGATLLIVRTALVASVWHGYAPELAAFRQVIEPIEAGARVLPIVGQRSGEIGTSSRTLSDGIATDFHRAALVMLERRAFWPLLFADPAQQPVRYLPPFDTLARESPSLPDYQWLALSNLPEQDRALFPLWRNWYLVYDYVLLLEPGNGTDLATVAPDRLELLRHSTTAALFKVRRAIITSNNDAPG